VYQWYYAKLEGIGDLSHEEKEEVNGILDPESVARRMQDREEAKAKKQQFLESIVEQ
jgi:hypothetical protein